VRYKDQVEEDLRISMAFDRVSHRGLLIKMLDAGFSVGLVKLIRFFFQLVAFESKSTASIQVIGMEAAVPPGAVLLPFVCNIYVSDPPRTQRTSLAL